MSMSARPTDQEIKELADVWYKKLDVHASVQELLPMVTEEDLEMQFPEGKLQGQPAFAKWYEGVIRIFFDEVHTLMEVTPIGADDDVRVKVVVNWQATRWKAPAAKSERIGFDAYQTWVVRRSAKTGKPVIARYIVDELRPMPGSPPL